MRRLALAVIVLVQTFSPSLVAAATPTQTTHKALAPIFIADPLPELSAVHAATEPWEGHKEYHRWMNNQMHAWEADWRVRQVTPPYTQEKRVMLRHMLAEHRQSHADKEAPKRSFEPATSEQTTGEAPQAPIQDELRPTGRAALFTPLPKMSPRLLQQRQNRLFNNK